MSELKINRKIRSGKKEVDEYIEKMEDHLLNMRSSNTLKLVLKLDEINGEIVNDLNKIIEGTDEIIITKPNKDPKKPPTEEKVSNLKVLDDSSASKLFDRIMLLYTKVKDIKAITDIMNSMTPEEIEEAKKEVLVPEGNIFEHAQKLATSKR